MCISRLRGGKTNDSWHSYCELFHCGTSFVGSQMLNCVHVSMCATKYVCLCYQPSVHVYVYECTFLCILSSCFRDFEYVYRT